MTEARPEAWLRGAMEGYDPLVMPVVHALVQAREEIESLVTSVPEDQVWEMPGGAASVGFHIRHLGGALDRLFTYARGEALNEAQKAFARHESTPGATLADLVNEASATIEKALAQLHDTAGRDLMAAREVGRAKLPTTMLGALFHGAEHSTRHAGQAITTAKILCGQRS
jgi:uncharacterized damage-inducible protein DinB